MAPFLLVEAPRLLFPFARQIVADAVQNLGFPPVLLDPIDFGAALHAQVEAAQAHEATGRRAARRCRAGRQRVRPSGRMNLYRAIGSIGGLTMVSRVLGFARDMIGSRLLGASNANDAFNLAFLLPNIFRRLFAEGAFSAGFVPLFSRRLQSGGTEDAEAFSSDILSVFMPTLLLVTIIFEIAMPAILLVVAGDYQRSRASSSSRSS